MATRTLVTLVDDLDGTDADLTLPFALEGVSYEIDLSDKHAEELREALARYIAAGRRVGGRKVSPRPAPSTSQAGPARTSGQGPARTRAIRAWAGNNGYSVSDRGRIPEDVTRAYDEAHAHAS